MRRRTSVLAAVALLAQALLLAGLVSPPSAAADWHDLTTLTADALPTWQTNGIAWTVEAAGGVVYVGGTFTSVRPSGAAAGVNEQPRNNLAAFDAATGELLPCAPSILLGTSGGTVRALKASPDGSRLYVGGSFSRVDGVGVSNLVSIDTSTCQLTAAASFRRPAVGATVRAIDATASGVYFGGDFTTVDTAARPRYAAVTTGGVLTAATVNLNLPVRAIVAAEDHGKVIVAGDFTSVNGSTSVNKLIGVDPATGAVVQTYPGFIPANSVPKVLIRDATSFFLGAEGTGGGVFDGRLRGSLDGNTLLWKDVCLGATQSLALYQGVLYSGSHAHDCNQTAGGFPDGKRHHLLAQSAYEPTTTILPWFPDTNGGLGEALGPRAMVVAGNQLYVVGEFTTVNGVPQQGITRFAPSPDTGYVDAPVLTASSKQVGKVLISWTAGWDQDDDTVTYELYRSDRTDPIYTTTVSSREWNRPRLSFMDAVSPGTTVSYRIRTSDGTNVSPKGAAVSVTAATTAEAYNGAVFEDGPSINWKLDETSGSVAADDSGSGRAGTYVNGTLGGASALATGAGRSVTFNGSTSRVNTTSTTAAPAPNTYSVELWFRTNSTRGGKLIGFGDNRTGTSSNYDRHLYLTNAGNVVYGNYNGATTVLTSPSTYRNNQWHHVVGTTGANGMRLYVDGVLVGKNAVTIGQSFNGFWKVGGDNLNAWPSRPSSDNYSGSIDEVAVYEKVLTPARVFAHYKLGRGTVTDTQAPTAPTGVTAAVSSSKVSLSWTASSDNMLVTGYQIHRSMVPGFTPSPATQVALVEDTAAVDTAPAGTWYYKVVAVDGVGNVSAGSNQVTVTAADTQAPTPPTGLTATPYGDQVDLTWDASTDDTGVTGYHVYRLASPADAPSASSLVGSSPTGAFTDTGVAVGTWYYAVVAFDAAGNGSAASAAVDATTTDASTSIDFAGMDALAPAPAFTSTQQSASTIGGATLVAPTDPRLTYRGASSFTFGTTFPDTLLYQPTSRYPNTWGTPSVWSVQFTTDAAQFEIYTKYYNAAQAVEVKVDGHRTTALPRNIGGTTLGSRMVYKVDFGSAAVRTVTLEVYLTPFGGIYLPPDATLTKSAPLTTRWMVLGDSITAGSNQNTAGGDGSWLLKAADYLGWDDPWNQSIGGTGYVEDNGGTSKRLIDRVDGDIAAYHPKRVVVWAGVNDQMDPQTTIAAAAVQLYAKLKAVAPGTRVYVAGPWSQSGSPDSSLRSTDETLRAAARDAGLPFFSPITGKVYGSTGALITNQRPWITGTGNTVAPQGNGNADLYVGADGVHPTDAGHAYIARRMALTLEQLTKNEPLFDTTAPSGPEAVTAAVTDQSVQLDWDAATDDVAVTGYDVYRGTSASFVPSGATRIAHLTGTSTTDSEVAPGTYYYKVTASDGSGNTGAPASSSQVIVVAADTQAPSVPDGVTTSVAGSDVTVGWNASSDDRGVAGYDLYRGDSADFTPDAATKVARLTGTSRTDSGVLGGTWYYKLVAFDVTGNRSDASAAALAVVVPPAPVTATLSTTADTYVNFGTKTTNYGTSASAIVDGSPLQQMLLRFQLPATPTGQQLTSAVLRVRTTTQAIASAANEIQVRAADDGWDETTVTYNTKPAVGTASLGSLPGVDVNTSYDIPLDAAALRILTGGNASLALVMAGDDNAQFLTRETGAVSSRPQLILTFS